MSDSIIAPITVERIATELDGLDMTYTRRTSPLDDCPMSIDGDTLYTGLLNLMITIDCESDMLRFRACWRGHPHLNEADHAAQIVNRWNLTQISPRLMMHLNSQGTIDFLLTRMWPLATGASNEQLAAICAAFLSSLSSCAKWLDNHYTSLSEEWRD